MIQLYFHSLHNLTEARFAASTYPTYIGFNFSVHQSNYVSPVEASKIIPWLAGVSLVGQFAYEPFRMIRSTMQTLELTTVEVPSDHPELDLLLNEYDIIILNGYHPKAKATRTDNLQVVPTEHLVFYEINSSQAYESISAKTDHIQGIAIKGKKEENPGMADLSDWATLMEILEVF